MTTVQYIKGADGKRMAVLPEKEFDALCAAAENAADVAAYDRVRERLLSGEEELIPEEFAARIIDGESPIRVFRELRGLKKKDLAEKAGLSAAYLSQLESRQREGSVAKIKALADALGVTIDDLVD